MASWRSYHQTKVQWRSNVACMNWCCYVCVIGFSCACSDNMAKIGPRVPGKLLPPRSTLLSILGGWDEKIFPPRWEDLCAGSRQLSQCSFQEGARVCGWPSKQLHGLLDWTEWWRPSWKEVWGGCVQVDVRTAVQQFCIISKLEVRRAEQSQSCWLCEIWCHWMVYGSRWMRSDEASLCMQEKRYITTLKQSNELTELSMIIFLLLVQLVLLTLSGRFLVVKQFM